MIKRSGLEGGGLILTVLLVTTALLMVVSGFISALLWATLAALLFQPLFQRLLIHFPGRRNLASAVTLSIITVAVVIPAFIISSLVIEQAAGVYNQVRGGQINLASYFQRVYGALPLPLQLQGVLDRSGFQSFEQTQVHIAQAVSSDASILASRALSFGADAFAFVLAFGVGLYVAFFLLRDGDQIGPAVVRALPLEPLVAERRARYDQWIGRCRTGARRAQSRFGCRLARCAAVGRADGNCGIAASRRPGDHLGAGCGLPSCDR